MNEELHQRIKIRAYEIYEYRKENGIMGSSTTDWLEAEEEICIDRRVNDGCPNCHFKLIARRDNKIICLKCNFEIETKRKEDENISRLSEIKKIWQ